MHMLQTIDIEEEKAFIKTLDYDTLAYTLICLEIDFNNLKDYLSSEQISKYLELLELYETEKDRIVQESSVYIIGNEPADVMFEYEDVE